MECAAGFNHVLLQCRHSFKLLQLSVAGESALRSVMDRAVARDRMANAEEGDDDDEWEATSLPVLPSSPLLSRAVQQQGPARNRGPIHQHVLGLWSLRSSTDYEALLEISESEDATGKSTTLRHVFRTRRAPFTSEMPNFALAEQHLSDEHVIGCCLCQHRDVLVVQRDLGDPRHRLDNRLWVCRMFYHALFILPSTSQSTLMVLPNGRLRYGVDLSRPIQWTRSKKMRHAISSGRYAVVANRSLRSSLNDAYFYHSSRGSTWMSHALIDALCDAHDSGESLYGVQMTAVELWDMTENAPVAGCLGFAVGSAYHDYTMYTLRRDKDSCGTLLTKVLGAALQACGYGLWYWGFRVAYMQEFEGRYGAQDFPRGEFLRRWCTLRDELPLESVSVFLNSGRALLPVPEAGRGKSSLS